MFWLSSQKISSTLLFSLLAVTLFRSGGILPEYIYNIVNYLQVCLVLSLYAVFCLSCTKDTFIKVNFVELLIILILVVLYFGKSLVHGLAHSIYFITVILYLGLMALSPPKLLKEPIRKSFTYFALLCTGALIVWYFYGYEKFYINPNGAAFFALSLSVFTHLLLKSSRLRTCVLFLLFIFILSTNSRGGIIAVSLFYTILFVGKWRWKLKNFGYLIFIIISLSGALYFYKLIFGQEFRIITRGISTVGHLSPGRFSYWETVFYDIIQNDYNILFGLKDNLTYTFGIHSAYIEMISRFGFVSLFLIFISQMHTLFIRLHGKARQELFTYSSPFLLAGLVESNGLFTITVEGVSLLILFWVIYSQYNYKLQSVK